MPQDNSPLDILLNTTLYGIPWVYLVGVVAAVVALSVLSRVFGRKQQRSHTTLASCGCGWSGQVGKHARICPSCNARL
ncbi:MAG: hypothetical protein AAFX99_16340 [Myxococcota bacterium]